MNYFGDFSHAIDHARATLKNFGQEVDPGRWQGVSTEGHPDLVTREVMNYFLSVPVARGCHLTKRELDTDEMLDALAREIQPNLPWADDHFAERVSRNPSNPGEQYLNWPWWRGQTHVTAASHMDPEHDEFAPANFRFDHTYQERFWPKHAGDIDRRNPGFHMGIRYRLGDLDDVVTMLYNDPQTRQAYLPIFFPEDTGAVHGGRIPCTLGYQLLLRNNQLHMWYFIRSCDFVRHFRDDIYLACRLQLWVLEQLVEKELHGDLPQLWVDVDPGYLHMLICSLHYHKGDEHLVYA